MGSYRRVLSVCVEAVARAMFVTAQGVTSNNDHSLSPQTAFSPRDMLLLMSM